MKNLQLKVHNKNLFSKFLLFIELKIKAIIKFGLLNTNVTKTQREKNINSSGNKIRKSKFYAWVTTKFIHKITSNLVFEVKFKVKNSNNNNNNNKKKTQIK